MNVLTLADALLAVAWALLLGDLFHAAGRARVTPARRLLGVGLLAVILGGGWLLERTTGGRIAWRPVAGMAGVLLAWAGLALHSWARRTLARSWSPLVTPSSEAVLTDTGPYAHLRHPLYGAILLLAVGTVVAHCSRATLVVSVGVALGIAIKRRAEDRALEARFGNRWRAYAARVPAFVPRLTRRRP